MRIQLQRFITFLDLCIQMPRQVKNWQSVLYHDVRNRMKIHSKPGKSEIRLRDGTNFVVYPQSAGLYSVFSEVYLLSCYNQNPSFHIQSTDTVIDIGAHVGFFTTKAAKEANHGRVLAFEPFPSHYKMLELNVKHNDLSNVSISAEAIWSSEGTLEFRYSTESGHLKEPLNTSFYDMGGTCVTKVHTVSLNQVFEREKIERCNFLKLDCEGAEYEILYAAKDKVLRSVDRIAMEWHKFDASHNPERLSQYLESKGFSVNFKANRNGKTGFIFATR